ncbi:hypothetical protein [Anaerococcus obesiensis]
MRKEIIDNHFIETKEVEVKKNKHVPLEYKKSEKTYTEDEVKEVENEVKE